MKTKKQLSSLAKETPYDLPENYKITINGTEYLSMDQFISGKQIKQIDEIKDKCSVWFKINFKQPIQIGDNDTLDLSRPGIEAFFSRHHN